jgi:peroxiredoxin
MPIVVFVVVVGALVVLAIGGWLIAQLRAQNAEIDLRLDDVEQAPSMRPRSAEETAKPARSFLAGMPASSVLNDFELPNLAGTTTTLSRWRGQRIALVFVHPECPYSREVLSAIVGRAGGDAEGLRPIIVSSGDAETNRAFFKRAAADVTAALQDDAEVARLLRVVATPAAYVVDRNGVTEGPLRFGADAVLDALGIARDSADGHKTTPLRLAPLDGLHPPAVGRVVPDVDLVGLDGGRIALGAGLARRAIVVLVEPDCPACRDLAPQLASFSRKRSLDEDVVVVSAADVEATRSFAAEFALTFAVIPDRARAMARAIGTSDSPAAVRLDPGGVVVAPVAVGVAAVAELLSDDTVRDTGSRRGPRRGRVDGPLVSVILTTRDRPGFLRFALTCFERQTYPNRELIVVDDGDRFPVDPDAVAAVGGRVVRATVGTPIGSKLNLGLDEARGVLCQKMDDDDWYAPAYVETMVTKLLDSWRDACRPTVAFVTPFLFFDVARWEIRRSFDRNVPGATLFFRRADWALHRFRALPGDEDLWFFLDQVRAGAVSLVIEQPELFLAVRHRGSQRERGHTWVNQQDNRPLEDYLLDRPLHRRSPERMLPPWAVVFYRELRIDLLAAQGAPDRAAARR